MTRVLVTGASSFTGSWLSEALAQRGAQVIAPMRGSFNKGDRLRQLRIRRARRTALLVERAPLGSQRLLDLIEETGPFDLVCLHGSEVGNFRSPDYDPFEAAQRSTAAVDSLLEKLASQGCRRLVASGSLFEADEGSAGGYRPAIGPYGLAKTLGWHAIRFAGERHGFAIGKVVIPSPFGPLEKLGLTSELMSNWQQGKPGLVRHPKRIRDFVPVQQLSQAHADFALGLPSRPGLFRFAPSGFAESVADFVERLATAMRPLLNQPCEFGTGGDRASHADDDEPPIRINSDPLFDRRGLDTDSLWRDLARFYSETESAKEGDFIN